MPRQSIEGVRLHVILPKPQHEALQRHSKRTGLTVSEHLRRAVDFYLASAVERTTTRSKA